MRTRIATALLIVPTMVVDLIKLPITVVYWIITGENLRSNTQELIELAIESSEKESSLKKKI